MSFAFTRTPTGIVGKWQFYQIPTIWVEGPTDIYFYTPVIDDIPCRIEAFHGSSNATALIDGLRDYDLPYLVILDGDYEILAKHRSPHKRVIRLQRYSFENYLWEQEPVNRACLRHARCGETKDVAGAEMERVAKHLKKELLYTVVLDIAARRSPNPPAVLPDAMEVIALNNSGPDIDPAKVAALVASVEPRLDPGKVKVAKSELRSFLAKRCITHLLNGHFILGILRRLFLRAAETESGKKSTLTNDAFTQMISDIVWRRCQSDDHKRLKRAIRTKTRNLVAKYPAQAQPTAASVA
jgi:hypothetical protein